jgi:hypothetical protein
METIANLTLVLLGAANLYGLWLVTGIRHIDDLEELRAREGRATSALFFTLGATLISQPIFAKPVWSVFIEQGPTYWALGVVSFAFVAAVFSALTLFARLRIRARIAKVLAGATQERPASTR